MDNVIEFKRSQNAHIRDAANADAASLNIGEDEQKRGFAVHSAIDFHAKTWRGIPDTDLVAASAVAISLAQSTRIEAESAGEPLPALADMITAAVSDQNPQAIRDLARRAERRLADVGMIDLQSRERRLVVAAWARRADETRRELKRREAKAIR